VYAANTLRRSSAIAPTIIEKLQQRRTSIVKVVPMGGTMDGAMDGSTTTTQSNEPVDAASVAAADSTPPAAVSGERQKGKSEGALEMEGENKMDTTGSLEKAYVKEGAGGTAKVESAWLEIDDDFMEDWAISVDETRTASEKPVKKAKKTKTGAKSDKNAKSENISKVNRKKKRTSSVTDKKEKKKATKALLPDKKTKKREMEKERRRKKKEESIE
jgi:hypothetical protein